jgi:hypothetical protein
MDNDAVSASALASSRKRTGEQCWRGASLKHLERGAPTEPIPTMSDRCVQTLECEALSWGISGKSTPILAEITIRKSQENQTAFSTARCRQRLAGHLRLPGGG